MTPRPWPKVLGCLALSAVLVALMLAYDGKRLFQLVVLALPAGLCLFWPSRHGHLRALQALFAGATACVFIVDGAIRAFLLKVYGASPASAMVMTAVANTTAQEATEFMAMYGVGVWLTLLFVTVSMAALTVSLGWWWRMPRSPSKIAGWRLVALLLLLTLVLLSLAIKPWRQHHPAVFWPQWVSGVTSLRDQWTDLGEQRSRLLANAQT